MAPSTDRETPTVGRNAAALRRGSSLSALVLPVIVMGGLALLHIGALAKQVELEYEARRVDRLCLEQSMRRAELLRERERLTSHAVLWEYATRHALVPAADPRPLNLGALPQHHVYWPLPGEAAPTLAARGTLVGWQQPPVAPSPRRGM